MKKLIKFFMLFSLVFILTSCFDDEKNSNVVYFFDEPAVVESLDETPVIRSAHDRFFVPSLNDSILKKGDLLWTYFTVYTDQKKDQSHFEAINFKYIKVDSEKIIMPADTTEFKSYLSDDYTAFIYDAMLYSDCLDKLLFFGFKREKVSDGLFFDYELIWNPEKERGNEYPTLYIRSKKIEAPSVSGSRETIFAFDMTDFIHYYKVNISDKNPVGFNLKYKIGTDEDGQDVYRQFRDNPIKWNVSDTENLDAIPFAVAD